MRTFIAVEIPEHIRESVYERITSFRSSSLPVKWVPCANLHITVKFLGEITGEMKTALGPLLENIAARTSSFAVTLKNYGCFPDPRRPRVVWIGVDQGTEELCALARDVEGSLVQCGFSGEGRFHPHLTLGRIKKPCSIDHIIEQTYSSASFSVNALILFKSILTPQGAVYQALETFRFAKTRSA